MRTHKLEIAGAHGHVLAARLDAPEGALRAYALFAHCFTCGKDALASRRIAQALTAHGIAVLRFDFAGLGASGGDFADTNFSSNVADLLAAAEHLRQHYAAPALLIGHSLGGTAILAAAGAIPEARAVVTLSSPSAPSQILGLFSAHLEQIAEHGEAQVQLAGRPFRIKRQFLDDAAAHSLHGKIAQLDKALLVMHAPGDTTVAFAHAMEIFTAAPQPKSFISLDDIEHTLAGRDEGRYVADLIAAWSARYLA
ncbi:alpha/beta fold hydrolase [Oxalobacteraceae bacterium]|nr:alpha/beta fold hydrolase [Oxalobacteraceae bacterium]